MSDASGEILRMTESGARIRPSAPAARLVGRIVAEAAARTWAPGPARVLTGAPLGRGWHPWQILGGPGTGKTSLIVDAAVARITAGADPESVLVLTQSRRAANAVREQITASLLAAETVTGPEARPRATREPLVRTVHSYAFAVLRLQAAAHGNPPPRLITGSEQDSVLRELLRGDIADGAEGWPERLRPALGMTGFAVELRNLMLRANERGLGPEDLIDLGHAHDKPEWVAAGRFAMHYEQSMLLRASVGMEAPEATAPALDAAELISAALTAFATDPDLLHRERARVRHLLVDDAQHLDPQAAQLVRLIGTGTTMTAIAGDPDQSIFAFRGADARFLAELADRDAPAQVILDTNFRSAPAVAVVAGRVASLLPGKPPQRGMSVPVQGDAPGRAVVRVLTTPAKEAALIADTLRRAHLIDGVPWSQMAIVARSVPRVLPPLRRALLAAGVPVTTAASELPLAKQHGVAGLLAVLRALSGGDFTGEDALALLSGPIGGAEPVSLRRLRRGLRRVELAAGGDRDSAELLRLLIVEGPDIEDVAHLLSGLTDVESLSLRRVLKVLRRARVPLDRGRGIEEVLWAAWQATGLERRWAAASAFGGPIGAQADRDLDAVVALFDAAADYVDRLPRAQLSGFVDYLVEQEIPGTARARAVAAQETVTILSAHSAAGRQWQVVAVVGVQEGLWPSLGARGTLLGTEELIDVTSGVGEVDPTLSRTAPLLAEERRLFLVACSRARSSLLVTAVDSSSGDTDLVRSRFVDDLLGAGDTDTDDADVAPLQAENPRVLALPALVAELRSVVCDPDIAESDPERQRRAAHQLARLADAGVRGAHPDQWYGTAEPSSDAALWDPDDGPVPLSPSTIELINNCPLRWMLERHGGSDGDNTHAIAGTLVHTLVQALAGHIPPDQVDHALETAWDSVDLGSEWYSRRELERTRGMLDTFANWLRGTRSELTEIGVEVSVDGMLEPRAEGDPTVRIRGRIDRLERDTEGRPVIIDVKTAKNAVTKEQAQQHAQLAAYQVAAARGLIEGEPASQPGGARLVFVAKPHNKEGATQRAQLALDDEGLELWENVIHDAAAATQGPTFTARINDGCRHCPVLSSCPAHDEGRQVTAE
ncbi:superfamily I DNA/RNA helicase/RecB family exonuclease [Prescottella agglutinans]|uniref:DNA 3'-5' helicase n=2 Tax=Prescottella agglutinans TaxID=1644129 RepID=A0ABT6MDQ0_9NOCA|nr:superfamily I DNA/RNA helicase/RecB family exonuclease [Prescottella agglutinans]